MKLDNRVIHVPTAHTLEASEEAQRNWGVKLRSSKHSLSGMVLDLWFPIVEEARDLANVWTQQIGVMIKVRKDAGGLFKVSVPVQRPSY